jgi:UDP-2,3-diacylglucosamine hydrolase
MIGLILGDTDFPNEILKKVKKKNLKYLIIDFSVTKKFCNRINSYNISIGQFGKIIRTLKKNKCNKVLFAGKIEKPKLSKLKLDFKGLYYISKIIKAAKLGDAAILKEIIKIFNNEKIKVLSSTFFNPELTLKKGIYSKTKPDNEDLKDIKIGIAGLNKLNTYDHIQGLIVRNQRVIAKESIKGTRKMIQSVKKTKNKTGLLIKFPKKNQDIRIDLPTIGIDTFNDCKKAKIKGVVIKAKKNIFLNRKECIKFANKNQMFIKVI